MEIYFFADEYIYMCIYYIWDKNYNGVFEYLANLSFS